MKQILSFTAALFLLAGCITPTDEKAYDAWKDMTTETASMMTQWGVWVDLVKPPPMVELPVKNAHSKWVRVATETRITIIAYKNKNLTLEQLELKLIQCSNARNELRDAIAFAKTIPR